MEAPSQRSVPRYAGVVAGLLLCAAAAVLFFAVRLDANVPGPAVHSQSCGTAVSTWVRPDARATLRYFQHLPPTPGSVDPAERARQLARVESVVRAANRYEPCRQAAAPRTTIAGILAFLGAVVIALSVALRRDPTTSRWHLGFAGSLALIAILAAGLRVSFAFFSADYRSLGFDASYYNSGWKSIGGSYTQALFPPAFTTYIAAVSAVGIRATLWHNVFSGLLGVSLVVMTALLGRRVAGDRVGLIAGAIAALYPMFVNADGAIMSDSLYAAFVTATLFVVYREREHVSTATWVVLGVLVGLATLTRGEGLFLIPFVLLPLALSVKGISARRRLASLGASCLVVVVLLAPWTIRNLVVMHHFIWVSNNAATVIAGANCPETYSGPDLGFWRVECLQRGYTRDVAVQIDNRAHHRPGPKYDETYQNNRSRAAAIRYARAHKRRLAVVVPVRVLRTWGFYAPLRQIKNEALIETRSHSWQLAGWATYLVMIPFAVYGAFVLRRRHTPIWPLLAVVAMVTFTSAITYGNERFRIAAEPAVIVLAAVGIAALVTRARRPAATSDTPVDRDAVHAVTGS